MTSKDEILSRLAKAIIEGDEKEAIKASEEAIAAGVDPLESVKLGAAKGMEVVGDKFHKLEIFLPEVMCSADAMKASMTILTSKIAPERMSEASPGKVVIGTVFGDIHDIGKDIVAAMLQVYGFQVYDLGRDVQPKLFVEKAKEVVADFIAMSSLITNSLYYQQVVVNLLKEMKIRNKYYVVVGGGAVSENWAKRIGADGYGRFADDGAKVCLRLIHEKVPPPLPEPVLISE